MEKGKRMRLLMLVAVGVSFVGLGSCSSDDTTVANDPDEVLIADWEYFIYPGIGEDERTEALLSTPGHVAARVLNQRTSITRFTILMVSLTDSRRWRGATKTRRPLLTVKSWC